MLKARVITALVLVFAFGSALFGLPQPWWLALMALIVALGAWEWAGLMRYSDQGRVWYGVQLSALFALLEYLIAAQFLPLWAVYLPSVVFWLFLCPFFLRHKPQPGSYFPLLGILVLLPPFAAAVHLRELSPWLLLAVMASVWLADIAAYFTGRAFGRRKLAPSISPGKSWEGAWGAVVAVVIYGVVLLRVLLPSSWTGLAWLLAVAALLVHTAISIIGDLFESLLKRQAGIKDSSQLLPGHGGILDRIDSLTSTLPLAGLFIVFWN